MTISDRPVGQLFEAQALTMKDIADNLTLGFVIPEYQREYQWDERNVTRLHEDILNGMYRLGEREEHSKEKDKSNGTDTSMYTFLGTIIHVSNSRHAEKETDFDGESLDVIDGQQRLTTLALIACAVCEVLREKYSKINFEELNLNDDQRKWLKRELDYWLGRMYLCAAGKQSIGYNETYWFSRIIREPLDFRGTSDSESDYCSPIGSFIKKFEEYTKTAYSIDVAQKEGGDTELPSLIKILDGESLHFKPYYKIALDLISQIGDENWYKQGKDAEMFNITWINKGLCRSLLKKLPIAESPKDKIFNIIAKSKEKESIFKELIYTMIYASYFHSYVSLVQVISRDEYLAFDIFDALNTTGLPLTALETLKPQVKKYIDRTPSLRNAMKDNVIQEAKELFKNTETYLKDAIELKSRDHHKETKDLIVTFALYWSGKKMSNNLPDQRNYLRREFRDSEREVKSRHNRKSPINFLKALNTVTKFRRYYWTEGGIEEVNQFHVEDDAEQVKLLMRVVFDMNHSLTLPILARYWIQEEGKRKRTNPTDNFLSVLRAMVAFIVFWRGYTGSTGRIDTEFRELMSKPFDLCAKHKAASDVKSVRELKSELKRRFNDRFGKFSNGTLDAIDDKSSWVKRAAVQPLYEKSIPLVRFIIFASRDGAKASIDKPGLLEKSDDIPTSGEAGFLHVSKWNEKGYSTVEHVAPRTRRGEESAWDERLYSHDTIIHSLGNLVLLPSLENSTISNMEWEMKKTLYNALLSQNKKEVEAWISKAKDGGTAISTRVESNLTEEYALPLLDSITKVEQWNSEVVLSRSKNICELCWDKIRGWLD